MNSATTHLRLADGEEVAKPGARSHRQGLRDAEQMLQANGVELVVGPR